MSSITHMAAIIIPVYKEGLNEYERISLDRCLTVLEKYPIILAAPENLDCNNYTCRHKNLTIIRFADKFFTSIDSYNKLLMAPNFYKPFLKYEYILIYQLDAYVFKDQLRKWCLKGYDYIGAPWIDAEWIMKLKEKIKLPADRFINRVGNGGLSLRKTETFYKKAKRHRITAKLWRYNEDFFWSTIVKKLSGLSTPMLEEAINFAFEDNPQQGFELNGQQLPFGCHAWEKYNIDFYKPFFKKNGHLI